MIKKVWLTHLEFQKSNMKSVDELLKKYQLNGIIDGCSTGSKWFSSGNKIESFSPVDGNLIGSIKSGSKNDPARVINIASINGLTHPLMPTYSYSSSKSALIHLTRHLGADLAKYNININAIAPGFFPSKMTSHIAENESLSAQVIERIPIKRMGAPEDIAGTAIYLSSKASSWICGETIVVDGGMVSASG